MLTATKLLAWTKKRRDELAHATLTTPPSTLEQFMVAVGEYKSLLNLEAMVRERSTLEDDPQ